MINNCLFGIASATEENTVISSIKKGLILLMPILITGAVSLMIKSLLHYFSIGYSQIMDIFPYLHWILYIIPHLVF